MDSCQYGYEECGIDSGIPRQLSGLWLKNRALLYKRDGKGEGEGERGRVSGTVYNYVPAILEFKQILRLLSIEHKA